jgi:hypothetical protein
MASLTTGSTYIDRTHIEGADCGGHGRLLRVVERAPWTSTYIDRTHLEGADCGGHGRLLRAVEGPHELVHR